MPVEDTHPGTEMKETPDMLAPIMPKPTIHQGEACRPRKNASLSGRRAVRCEMASRMRKYATKVAVMSREVFMV